MCYTNRHIIGDIVEQDHYNIRSSIKMELYWWSDVDIARVEGIPLNPLQGNYDGVPLKLLWYDFQSIYVGIYNDITSS